MLELDNDKRVNCLAWTEGMTQSITTWEDNETQMKHIRAEQRLK